MPRDDEPIDSTGHDPDDEPSSEGSDPDKVAEEPVLEDDTSNRGRVLRFARRLLDRKEITQDTKLLVSAVLNTSDKAKTEAVRLMAREFRSYLKELKLKEDLLKLATSHSLEISIHLKPLFTKPTDEET